MSTACDAIYGAEFCQNVRRYNMTSFATTNNFQNREADQPRKSSKPPTQTRQMPLRTRPLQPSIKDLTQPQMDKARLVKASRIAYEQNFEKAQAYLDEQSIPYDIDAALSSKESLVLLGDEGVKIAYRGTKIKNLADVRADADIVAGNESSNPQFKSAERQLELVTEKYGVPNELVGYSLGGAKAITLGTKIGINTTTFNPFLGKNLIGSASSTDATHEIFRTTEDFASLGVGLARNPKWTVRSILPHQDKLNPIEAHELNNFTETSTRRPGHTENIMQSVQRQGMKVGELELIHAILSPTLVGNCLLSTESSRFQPPPCVQEPIWACSWGVWVTKSSPQAGIQDVLHFRVSGAAVTSCAEKPLSSKLPTSVRMLREDVVLARFR